MSYMPVYHPKYIALKYILCGLVVGIQNFKQQQNQFFSCGLEISKPYIYFYIQLCPIFPSGLYIFSCLRLLGAWAIINSQQINT